VSTFQKNIMQDVFGSTRMTDASELFLARYSLRIGTCAHAVNYVGIRRQSWDAKLTRSEPMTLTLLC
jgi:hypothetical protein